ncbi:MAG: HAD family phosphatase [Cytophagales bacterium]|nr:HAD family phosphatase [Bernardetiaceae bacterium]MDW8211349.1 HAD family phosphatase [Cytophagales bacterium]
MLPRDFPNIIFDLGGVLLNIDIPRTIAAFSEAIGKDFSRWYSQHKQSALFDAFEIGKITPEQFRQQLRQELQTDLSDAEIDRCWNAMLIDFPQHRLALLEEIGKKRRIFLLSNTNAIHKAAFDSLMQQQHGIESFSSFFEQDYYSHLLGMRKPNAEIFLYLIEKHGLKPQETLFIDDTLQHVEGARKAGLQALHLPQGKEVVELFA